MRYRSTVQAVGIPPSALQEFIAVHLDHLPGTFFGPSNLVELLRHRARCQPQDTAFTYLVDGEREEVHLTYLELDRQARAIGAWLESQDLAGERALLLYPAGVEFIAAFFGCLYGGVIAVPVYPPRRNRSLNRIQAIADDAGAKIALTTDAVLGRVMPLIDETPHLKQLTWLATCHVPAGTENAWDMPDVHGDTLAFLQYTSGSTGTPKGVVLNHANLMHNSALIAHAFEHTRSGTGVFWLPSYHDMGLIGGILQPMYIGRPNVLMSPMTFLQKPYRWLSAITRYRGTTSGGPNFAYDLCVRKIAPEQRKTLDLSSWKVAFNGAEPVRAETIDAFCEAFEPCGFRREAFYPCYGLAEATLIVSGGFVHEPPVIRAFDAAALTRRQVIDAEPDTEGVRTMVGCGRNLPDQTIVIVDPETCLPCDAGQVGEIWVRGPSMAQGYWQRGEATEAAFRACLKNNGEGPFMRTGDLGFLQDGELFVTGRVKDLIIFHGVNYYPQDIESTVQQCHPRLRLDCGAVFAVERDGREQLIVVQEVERRKQADLSSVFDAICRAVAAEHELAAEAVVLIKAGSIPKTSSGKIQRHACRVAYLAGELETVGAWSAADGLPLAARSESAAAVVLEPKGKERVGKDLEDEAAASAAEADLARQTAAPSRNGRPQEPKRTVTEVVLEEIRRVGKDRTKGMTLDSPIVETGMDSLERMEILASLEERFGGRFPEEILPDLETTRQLIAAVEKYLGTQLRRRETAPAAAEIPPGHYRIDQFPEYLRLRQNLDLIEHSPFGNPFFAVHDGIANNRTSIDGKKYINFSSYNYVGMAGEPAVSQAAKEAIDLYGTSVSASRLVSGERPFHVELEKTIAQMLGTEDALTFNSGHATNESVIGHLLGPGDLILHDGLAHNSIVQGSMLSGARRRPFAHNDWREADRLLADLRRDYRRVLIAIEGVYSMDGDMPDLPKFIEVKKRRRAMLMIDEAHSVGVLGLSGIGGYYGVDPQDVEVWMGTLSKALGSGGGYIAGGKALVDYLRYTAPSFVFSGGINPAPVAAALAAIRFLEKHPERFARLRENSALFLGLCKERGMNTGTSKDTPVVPVILGNSIHALMLSRAMLGRGVNVMPILHPAVEESATRLRFFITSMHAPEEIRYTVDALAEELEKIDPK
ncbi:MAG: aminotransferase class I/II-fold pyridoxal phosphate-dependent enzyme [Pirellulales bacterium]|nr:aminotransferase class I/II-fold pyridoxal phosphate-dependent enzyme [Pirellulales bacterium]